jgi:hypothetical protein
MSYQPPEYGRYNPGPVFRADGTHRKFRIYDGAYLPSEPILDWRHKFKRPWEGTQEEAEELCRLLNRDREVLGKPVRSEMTVTSKSQKIWRMNQARKRSGRRAVAAESVGGTRSSVAAESVGGTRSTKSLNVIQSLFVKCENCGSMVNGGEHVCI